MATTTIGVLSNHPTVRFAALELARYLKLATGRAARIVRGPKAAESIFCLGLPSDVGVKVPANLGEGDDWVRVLPDRGSKGYTLTGSNPRSVLFAVYRYLQAVGFRWVRPGKRGQIVPRLKSPLVRAVNINERPSCKYRSICIEGACSVQHVCDLIDWMAKHSMNGYFIQFNYGTIFFRRWYEHRGSNVLKAQAIDQKQISGYTQRVVDAITKRGMSFERMGHGWTCAALGITGEGGWDKTSTDIVPPEKRDWLAQVNGKRELWGGVALNTNLNYGNPAVRSSVVDGIVAYAREHPEVNLLHFWLADGANNHDERPESQAARPSDFYVEMLNELDEKLIAANIPTRIVFLVYVDLLWAPERSRVKNPDRFTLMFAPITRSYLTSFVDGAAGGASGGGGEQRVPFVRNKLVMPKSAAVNISYLKDWENSFRGDGFDFDYHLLWACFYDPNMFTMARTLHRDIQGLEKIGLQGINSVQCQRMSFPHNLLLDVLARTLWNKKLPLKKIINETFADAFGRDGAKAAAFFAGMSKLWLPFFEAVYIPTADQARIAQGLANMPKLWKLVRDFEPVVAANLARADKSASGPRNADDAVLWSWRYLRAHLDLLELLLPMMEAYLRAEPTMREKLNRVEDYLWKLEKTAHPALDPYEMTVVLRWRANELENYLKPENKAPVVAVD